MNDSRWYFVVEDDIYAVVSKEVWSTISSYALDGWFVVSKEELDRFMLLHADNEVRWLFDAFPRNFVYGGALNEYVASYETEILNYFAEDNKAYIKFWNIFNKESDRLSRDHFNENLITRLDTLSDKKLSTLVDRDALFDFMMKTMILATRN